MDLIRILDLLIALFSMGFGLYKSGTWPFNKEDDDRLNCRPYLPKVFAEAPPPADHPAILRATQKLDRFLSKNFEAFDIDALSVAVVTSEGPVFEKNWGLLRAKERASPPVSSRDSYRVASVSKLFATLEAFVLEQRGVLRWDDPVHKYLPDFEYMSGGYAPNSSPVDPKQAPITLFQLATHMSGLGRDLPSGMAASFPNGTECSGPPPENCLPFPEPSDVFNAIRSHPLVSPPFSYPSYSNTGFGVLGLALVAANRAASANPSQEPKTYAELVKRDIFDPLGLDGSHFLKTGENKGRLVTPSLDEDLTELDFKDSMNAAGGQYLSLADAVKVVQMILNPARPDSILTQYSVTRWLRAVHEFDEDQWTAIGMMWEVIKHRDTYGRLHKIFWKLGNLPGYHSAVALHPDSSYGVVVLIGGQFADAPKLAYDAFDIMQPAFDKAQAGAVSRLYTGKWEDEQSNSSAVTTLEKGTLYVDKLVVNGTDVLPVFGASSKLALRSTQRPGEFRIDTGMPPWNGLKYMGCYSYWNGQDNWAMKNGAPLNLVYFSGSGDERTLHVPAAQADMTRSLWTCSARLGWADTAKVLALLAERKVRALVTGRSIPSEDLVRFLDNVC